MTSVASQSDRATSNNPVDVQLLLERVEAHRRSRLMRDYLRAPLRVGLDHLGPVLTPESRLLDLGCGSADVTHALSDASGVSIGVDLDEEALRVATCRGEVCGGFIRGDAHHLPFERETFDAIISISTLQYGNWRRTIRECRRILKPGGRALFVENLRGNPFALMYRVVRRLSSSRRARSPRGHIRWEERLEFAAAFDTVAFSVHNLVTPALYWSSPELWDRQDRDGRTTSRPTEILEGVDAWLIGRVPALASRCWTLTAMCTVDSSTSWGNAQ